MRGLLTIVLLTLCLAQVNAQTCTGCTQVFHNYTGDLKIKNNQAVCLTGTFSGSIDLQGGSLTICGQADISVVNFKQLSTFTIIENARATIQSINSNKAISLINYSDSFVIMTGNFVEPFSLRNYGKTYIQGGTFNSTISIANFDTLFCNTNIDMNADADLRNTGYMVLNGDLNPNSSNILLENQCQFQINGDLNLNSQTLDVVAGYVRINNVNMTAGKINLHESSILYVNQINVTGSVEGIGSRSTLVCTRPPVLNSSASLKGNLSLCVQGSSYTPPAGTVQSPATVDCNNPIPPSKCNPEGFGYAAFRLVPQQSSDWTNSANWEMLYSTGWGPAPVGRYPTAGAAVLIGDGKTMTVSRSVTISKLVLGESSIGARLVLDSAMKIEFKIEDTLITNGQSPIELNRSHLFLSGIETGDLNLKGGDQAILSLNLKALNGISRMNQSVPGVTNKLLSLDFRVEGSNPFELADTLIIVSHVIPISGVLKTNDKLVLESSAGGTAYIAAGPEGGNYIQGKVNVQSYIPAVARRYRFVSSSVSDATLLDWQQEVYITGNNAAGTATGNTVGQLNSAGFDATSSNATSMYWYDETDGGNLNNGWVDATNETGSLADYPLPVGRGYRLFIRGDRSDLGRLDGTVEDQNEVVVTTKGTPNMGEITVPVTFNDLGATLWDNGWNLLGNPYPSNIDWKVIFEDSALHPNIEPIVWTYDPNTNGYISYNALTGAGSLHGGLIGAGQSFWVKADGPAAPIVFKEKYKSTNAAFLTPRSEDDRGDELKITLYKNTINQNQCILKYFADAIPAKGPYDVLKYWGGEIGVSFYNPEDTSYLELSTRPPKYEDPDDVKLYFYVDSTGPYELIFEQSYSSLLSAPPKMFLVDKFTNTYKLVHDGMVYQFDVDKNNAGSNDPFRFSLQVFPASPVAVVNYFFATPSDTETVLLEWGSLKEPIPTTYNVERGLNPNVFESIVSIPGTGSALLASDYEYLDTTVNGYTELYYRIAHRDTISDESTYTPIIKVNRLTGETEWLASESMVSLYPNPVGNTLTIQSKQFVSKQTELKVMDMTGKQWISFQCAPVADGLLQMDCSQLPKGFYVVHIKSEDGVQTHHKILKH